MVPSKTRIDRTGKILLQTNASQTDRSEAEDLLDSWRQLHLAPLTEVTLKLQEWLQTLPTDFFFIAQRLKRKPQIISKLKRSYPMRLSQMQDIGGCRAIFKNGNGLDEAWKLIKEKSRHKYFSIYHEADYRDQGRNESGYRAVHLIVDRNGFKIEIQLRTVIQHAWAEEVERTSIICQSPLKEGQGPAELIDYFHVSSDALYRLDRGQHIPQQTIRDVVRRRQAADGIVGETRKHLLSGFEINSNYVRGLEAKQQGLQTRRMTNWVLIFNWQAGTFQHWAHVETNPEKAAGQYSSLEKQWKFQDGYEVVLIGANSVSTIQQTHSHYFGINTYDDYMRQISDQVSSGDGSVIISNEAISILDKMRTKKYWKTKKVSYKTLRNHYCAGLDNFDKALLELIDNGYILSHSRKGPFTLSIHRKADIEHLLS